MRVTFDFPPEAHCYYIIMHKILVEAKTIPNLQQTPYRKVVTLP